MIDINIQTLDIKLFEKKLVEYFMENGKNPKYIIMNKKTAEDVFKVKRQKDCFHLVDGVTIILNGNIPILIYNDLKYGTIDIV